MYKPWIKLQSQVKGRQETIYVLLPIQYHSMVTLLASLKQRLLRPYSKGIQILTNIMNGLAMTDLRPSQV